MTQIDINRMRTTTLLIRKPADYTVLSNHYRIERYIVPGRFHNAGKTKYGKLHVCIKEQLDYPYVDFRHDEIDGSRRMVIYVLYPRDAAVINLTLDFLSNNPIEHHETGFEKLAFHMLVKLLQSAYFKGRNAPEFVGLGRNYIFARKKGNADICLQINIKGSRTNKESDTVQAFQVSGQAKRFIPDLQNGIIEDWKKKTYAWYRRVPRNGQIAYNQVKPEELDNIEGQLYRIDVRAERKPSLDFHNLYYMEQGRGKILYDFTCNFIDFLRSFGIEVEYRWRNFSEHKTKTKDALALSNMGEVYLFDNRLNKLTVPSKEYLKFIQNEYPDLKINLLENLDDIAGTKPVLLLLDASPEDFNAGEVLQLANDPYKDVYTNPQYSRLPKQSININPNDGSDFDDPEEYLDYSSITQEKTYSLRFDVCMHQLFLKQIVMNDKSVLGLLPGLETAEATLARYIFVRRKTYGGEKYTVALYIKNGQIQFFNLLASEQKRNFYDLVEERVIDWDDVLESLVNQSFKNSPKDLTRFDVIITDGIAIEIEDINERVLYDFEEIEHRQDEVEDEQPINDFRLIEHYDQIKNNNMYTLAELEKGNLKSSAKAKRSKAFLEKLKAFDEFLDELGRTHSEISFNALVSGDRLERIGAIFDLSFKKTKKEGQPPKYNHAQFKRYYQKLNRFQSLKSSDVILYKGIWYDDENCYLVGNPDGMKEKQDRGSVIRKFNVLAGDPNLLDIELLLDTMAVKFVRKNRYTVHSYFYHLIDLFVSEVLQSANKNSDSQQD